MRDSFGRTLSYLRVSVTDRCNLRCRYCMPEGGVPPLPHQEILSFDEIERLVRIMAGLGVRRVRLTGGEPLVRKNLPALAAQLAAVPGIDFLGLTTNGALLAPLAAPLCEAGVKGVNISLDTTSPARFAALTRRDCLPEVLRGIKAALAQPFQAVRLNCVLAPQSRPEDWLGVAALARQHPLDVRLIEWMPMAGEAAAAPPADEALRILNEHFGPLTPASDNTGANGEAGAGGGEADATTNSGAATAGGEANTNANSGATTAKDTGAGPARYWHAPGFAGRLGLIPAMSHSFCQSCNRLRLTATGRLRLCLFYEESIDLKGPLRAGAGDAELAELIQNAAAQKPQRHPGRIVKSEATGGDHPCGMARIGG